MIGFVRYQSDGVAQLSYQPVGLVKRYIRKACHGRWRHRLAVLRERRHHLVVAEAIVACILPGCSHLRSDLHIVQLHIVPEDDLRCLREHGEMKLFGVAVHAHIDAAGIHPSATVLSWCDVVEVTYDIIAQVVLKVLCRGRITRLGTCP